MIACRISTRIVLLLSSDAHTDRRSKRSCTVLWRRSDIDWDNRYFLAAQICDSEESNMSCKKRSVAYQSTSFATQLGFNGDKASRDRSSTDKIEKIESFLQLQASLVEWLCRSSCKSSKAKSEDNDESIASLLQEKKDPKGNIAILRWRSLNCVPMRSRQRLV